MAATSANQQPEAFRPTTETSPEPSRVDEDIEDADIPESVKAVVKDLSERFEESTNPTFGEPATGGINLVQLLLEMKQDLAVNRLEMKQDVAGIKEELLNKMVENETKLTTDAAAREKRALEWQEKVESDMKARDDQWQSEMEDYYAKMVATVKSDLTVELFKTVSMEAQVIRADLRRDVTTVGEEMKTTGEQLRTELIKRMESTAAHSTTDKATLIETVKLQSEELIQGEVLKLKDEYANVSAQLLELDQVVTKVSKFANEALVTKNESKKILKEVQKHVAKNKKMITAGENVVPNDKLKQMVDGWTVIQNEWKALETVFYRKMEAFQDTHGSLEQLTKSVESHQLEFIKYSEQMRLDIDSADKFVEEVLPTVFRATDMLKEFSKVESTLPTIESVQQVIQEDVVNRQAVMQQCLDYRTQVDAILAKAKQEVRDTVQMEVESKMTEITATCNVETLKCIGELQKCESILPEIEAAMARLTQLEGLRLEQRIGDLERVPAIQVLPPNEPPLFSDEERVQELVSQALLAERDDVRRWYMEGFREQTAEQAALIDQRIRNAKDMMLLMYTKIKESLRAATRGNIMRIEEIVDIAMNLVKGSENYQVATEELIRGLSEMQHRQCGEELYEQVESTMVDVDLHLDESELDGGQNKSSDMIQEVHKHEVPVCVIMQSNDSQGGNIPQGYGHQNNAGANLDQSSQQSVQSNQESQRTGNSGGGSRRNRGGGPPRQSTAQNNPFAGGNLFGCFLTVSGRPNIAWTKSEYERLTRNGYNLVRIYDNFEQAYAWLRRKRKKYRQNNPDAADADWSSSDEDDNNESGGGNDSNNARDTHNSTSRNNRQPPPQDGHPTPREEQHSNPTGGPNATGQNLGQNQQPQSPFCPFDARAQPAHETARDRRCQSRGYGNQRSKPNEVEDPDDYYSGICWNSIVNQQVFGRMVGCSTRNRMEHESQ
jgi:hypothetical protein